MFYLNLEFGSTNNYYHLESFKRKTKDKKFKVTTYSLTQYLYQSGQMVGEIRIEM